VDQRAAGVGQALTLLSAATWPRHDGFDIPASDQTGAIRFLGWNRVCRFVHQQAIHQPPLGMAKGSGQACDDCEAEALPARDRRWIKGIGLPGADDAVAGGPEALEVFGRHKANRGHGLS